MWHSDLTRGLVTGFSLSLVFGACFGGNFVQGLPCERDADCGPQLRCLIQGGETEGLCGGPGDTGLCGNGLWDAGEECDDGNIADGDECTPECHMPVCGDGFLAAGEECDDGNTADGDNCMKECRRPSMCGNGVVEPTEECDDGNTAEKDACTPACLLPVCGDGFGGPGEACDDGNDVGTDECTPMCSLPVCNDGFVNTADEACDDGNAVETDECTSVCTLSPEAPTLVLSLAQVKQFKFSWTSLGAEYYQLFERKEAGEEFVIVSDDLVAESFALTVPLYLRLNASYKLRACNALRCVESEVVDIAGTLAEAVGYIKASNANAGDRFGTSVALSGDGNTLAIGAVNAGAAYVFTKTGESWSQQAYVKASNADAEDSFGVSLTLSQNGDTLAVGAMGEASQATGINPGQDDNSAVGAGAVYVFTRADETWSQQAYVKASNTGKGDSFGKSVALSGSGDTLAVGAYHEESQATGINNVQDDNSATFAGAVYVFTRMGETWSQQAYVKASNTDPADEFGVSVALSGDGSTLSVGASGESSSATGIGGDQSDNSAGYSGAVYVFQRMGDTWSQQAYVKASNTHEVDLFGVSIALSQEGDTLAVGAEGETLNAGAFYVFVRQGDSWSQQAYVKASNTGLKDRFGTSVVLSEDGNTLAVGAPYEDSQATGLNGDSANEDATDAGAAYVFVRTGNDWSQRAFVKASKASGGDQFGLCVALSGDGTLLAVGAPYENYGLEPNTAAFDAGAIYLY